MGLIKNGTLHREKTPAEIKQQYRPNKSERLETSMPEITYFRGTNKKLLEQWLSDGVLHRIDGPACVEYYSNGVVKEEQWCINGIYHNENNPAYINYNPDGSKKLVQWFNKGKRHRLDGPAFIGYSLFSVSSHWFINGIDLTNKIVPWIETNGIDLTNPNDLMRLKLTWA